MKKKIITSFLLLLGHSLFLYNKAIAQQTSTKIIDSLKQQLQFHHNDTNQVKAYVELCSTLSDMNPKDAIAYGLQGLQETQKIKWRIGEARLNNVMARAYFQMSEYDKALICAKKALSISSSAGDLKALATAHGNLGAAYDHQGNYSEALSNYFENSRSLKKIITQHP